MPLINILSSTGINNHIRVWWGEGWNGMAVQPNAARLSTEELGFGLGFLVRNTSLIRTTIIMVH